MWMPSDCANDVDDHHLYVKNYFQYIGIIMTRREMMSQAQKTGDWACMWRRHDKLPLLELVAYFFNEGEREKK